VVVGNVSVTWKRSCVKVKLFSSESFGRGGHPLNQTDLTGQEALRKYLQRDVRTQSHMSSGSKLSVFFSGKSKFPYRKNRGLRNTGV